MKRILPLLLLLLLQIPDAMADGMVAKQRMQIAVAENVNIPDQRALIWFTNGIQRLVIETRFSGPGSNFCWVVPLPSKPVIESSTTGLFPTLEALLAPEVVHNPIEAFTIAGLATLILFVFLLIDSKGEGRSLGLLFSALAAVMLGIFSFPVGMLGMLVVLWGYLRLQGARLSFIWILLLMFLTFVIPMLLPALGRAQLTPAASGVTELDRRQVGIFEVSTVSSSNTTMLIEWLTENGFEVPRGMEGAVREYVNEGWVFSVAKVNREDSSAITNSIHPLAFTFRTVKPVYPMRLTGLNAKELKVDLYVFGSQRAKANGFDVERCCTLVESGAKRHSQLSLAHPELRKRAEGSSVVTKLSGKLDSAAMKRDVWIEFEPYRAHLPQQYSYKGAAVIAANWASPLLFLGLLGGCLVSVFRKEALGIGKMMLLPVVAAALVFVVLFVSLPKVQIHMVGRFNFSRIPRVAAIETLNAWEENRPATLQQARRIAAELIAVANKERPALREEDSPGNYIIRETSTGFEFVWYLLDGTEDSVTYERP